MHSTKISGLAVDTEYTFHLILRTSAGTFHSDRVTVRTHKMTDLSGVTITTGILPATTKERLTQAVERIGAKIVDGVRIDTTHFVTTEGRGQAWEKAVEQNIPVVRPEWVDACEKNGRILGVTKFYLDAMRPGPQPEEAATPVTPQNAPQATSAPPPASEPGTSEKAARDEEEERKPAPPKKDSVEAPVSSGSESDENAKPEQKTIAESEPKARAPEEEEQKVRLEDKDTHQVPLRPKQEDNEKEESADDEDDSDDGDGDGKGDQGEKKKLGTAHDGSSFQEVAL